MNMIFQTDIGTTPTQASSLPPLRSKLIQRKCDCSSGLDMEDSEHGNKEMTLQRSSINQNKPSGHDFSRVRVHADAAEQEADAAAPLIARGEAVSVTTGQGIRISRQDSKESAPEAGTTAAGATAAPAAEEAKTPACALKTYTGSNLVGDTVTADVEFTSSLDKINKYASDNNVDLHVTSSFRTSTDVPGAVVTPATMSNHLAGHAIDMNVKYGDKKEKWCNSTCLGGTLPAGVSGFIKAIQDDSGLRWGGDFSDKDPVHIDDNLNADAEAWKKRKEATQAARKSGCG